jgi:hypothetical protein
LEALLQCSPHLPPYVNGSVTVFQGFGSAPAERLNQPTEKRAAVLGRLYLLVGHYSFIEILLVRQRAEVIRP